jgi:hypothetical protein
MLLASQARKARTRNEIVWNDFEQPLAGHNEGASPAGFKICS